MSMRRRRREDDNDLKRLVIPIVGRGHSVQFFETTIAIVNHSLAHSEIPTDGFN